MTLLTNVESSKHDTLKQRWFHVGPSSATLAQHQTNIASMYRTCWNSWRNWWQPWDREVWSELSYYYNISLLSGCFSQILAKTLQLSCISLHSAISECHSHPLRFCVALTHIQHHGSLSSVTSPSANQQPAVHKWATSGEVDRDWPVVFKCTPAHPLPTHGNLCTQCSSYKPEGIHECTTFNFIFIDN